MMMSFGFSILVTPGIQLISFVLLMVLIIKKSEKVGQFYKEIFGQSDEESEKTKQNTQNRFKRKL